MAPEPYQPDLSGQSDIASTFIVPPALVQNKEALSAPVPISYPGMVSLITRTKATTGFILDSKVSHEDAKKNENLKKKGVNKKLPEKISGKSGNFTQREPKKYEIDPCFW